MRIALQTLTPLEISNTIVERHVLDRLSSFSPIDTCEIEHVAVEYSQPLLLLSVRTNKGAMSCRAEILQPVVHDDREPATRSARACQGCM